MMKSFENVEVYLEEFEGEVKERLIRVRALIKEAAPEAVESISYGMPAYKAFGKPMVYFAGQTKHLGFYATPSGHEAFAAELDQYKQGKGSVQFPYNQPLPEDLISRMTRFKWNELEKKFK
jgi:uncharacterized protein YdhG (YjbR/CyaY superfamily)